MPWGAEASKSRVTPKVLAGTAGLARFLVIPGGHIEQPHLASPHALCLYHSSAEEPQPGTEQGLTPLNKRDPGAKPRSELSHKRLECRTHIPVLSLSRCPASPFSPSVMNAPVPTLLSKRQFQTSEASRLWLPGPHRDTKEPLAVASIFPQHSGSATHHGTQESI